MQREFKISLSQEFYSDIVYLSQYDSDYPVIFTVTDKYSKASGINGYTAKFTGTRGDGTGLGFTYTTTAIGHTVSFTIDTMLTGVAGTHAGEIIFYDQNGLYFGTANVQIIVEPAARPDGTIDADEEELRDLAQQCQDIVDTAAAEVKGEAEAWAVGERDGEPVPSTDPAYQNNAKYYAEQAAQIAEDISGVTNQVATNTSDISDLKEDLNEIDALLIDRSVNVFDTVTISEDTVLNSSGNGTSTSTSYFTSDYINVSDFSTTKLYRDNGVAVVAYNTYYVLFDASKAPLGARAVGNAIDTSNAYYLRFSAAPAQLNEVMVCDGSATAPADYVEYDVSPKYAPLIAQNTANIAANTQDIAAFTTTVRSANLIDKSQAVVGFLHSDGSIITSDSYANYKTSDYIPVTANTTYTLYYANSTGQSSALSRLTYLLYNASKVAGTYVNQSGVRNLTITPAEDGYVRVSTVDNTTSPYFTDLLMLIEGTTIIPYEEYHAEEFLSDDINPINSKAVAYIDSKVSTTGTLTGKKWAHCGDSFSDYTNAQFSSGTFVGKDKTYPRLIAGRNEMTLLQQFMLSGRTMAYPADGTFTNSLTCPTNSGYFQNIPSDVDYVTIMLGINDVNHANGSGTTPDGEDATGVITLGTIDDTSTATYYGAYNTVCAWLRENRPFAHVGIVITNGTQRQDYTEAQIAIAKKWGYPYINLNGDERTPAFIRCYNPNLPTALKDSLKTIQGVDAPSNTHPNWQTHELESTIIEAWLRSL